MVDQQRWDDARSVLAGQPTPGAVRRRRTRVRRRIGVVILATALPIVLAVLVIRFKVPLPDLEGHSDRLSSEIAALVATGVGLAVETLGLIRLLRDRSGLVWNSPLTALTLSQRRALVRAVRRGRAVDATQFDIAVYLAQRLQRQGPLLLMLLGITIMSVGRALSGSLVAVVVAALAVACLAPAAVLVRRDARRAQRWLDRFGRMR